MAQIIHLYRPQRTEAENLEAIFVARQPLLQDILDRLRKWRRCGSRQHYLIIGPRGIGKTNLVRLIEHRIHHDPDLSRIWCPISLSEEAYGITNVADLFVEALRILSEETSDSVLGHCYERIRFDNDDTRVIDLSLDAFRNYCKNSSVGILLILENVNRLFERPRRQRSVLHLLRKILIEEEWLTTICTSATYLNAVTKPEEPLFEFFQVHVLSELTPDEQLQLLHKLAILEKRVDLENKLPKFRSQLRALYHFTGGNPRLTIMLYDLIANQNITDVKTELDRLLDQLTPFYQDRMKDIPEQEAKLLETMALMSEGCTPTELANQARMQRKVVRALLTRLAKAGYLRAEERRRKRTVYIIPERFFRIWHQMNHSRQARGRVQYLLEFFSNWYATKEERDKIWDELTAKFQEGIEQQDETPGDDIAEYMMYIAAVSQGGEKFQREFDRLRNIAKVAGAEVIQEELAMLDEEYDSDGDYFVHKGYFLANDLNRHEEALSAFQKAFELSQGDIAALFNQAVALEKMGRTYKAKKIYEDCVALLIGQAEYGAIEETTEVLLHVLGQDSDSQRARMAALLLGRMPDKSMVEELINFLNSSQESWRRRYCATALGQIGAEPAVEPLIECLKDEANDVRGSAATALGQIGSVRAVEPLIECLRDKANNVRRTALAALGRIASETSIPELPRVTGSLIEVLRDEPRGRVESVIQILLRSAFRSANFEVISQVIGAVTSRLNGNGTLCRPYITALQYLKANRDPAMLERQHPEMREAVQLLIDVYDAALAGISNSKS